MKKLFIALAAFPLLLLAACQPSTEDVARKLEKGEELSAKESRVALDYTLEALTAIGDSVTKYQDDAAGLLNSLQELNGKYTYAATVSKYFDELDPSTLDAENRKVYDRCKAEYKKNFDRMQKIVNVYSSTADFDNDGAAHHHDCDAPHDSLPESDYHQLN